MLLAAELRNINFKLSAGDVERKLYPHFLSHHVGSDLHDCPTSDRSGVLRKGNVVTIEPGLYVPFDDSFPKAFHGLGVRIEVSMDVKSADGRMRWLSRMASLGCYPPMHPRSWRMLRGHA